MEEMESQREYKREQWKKRNKERKMSGVCYMCSTHIENDVLNVCVHREKNVAYAAISAYRSLSLAFFAHHFMRSFFVQTNKNVNSNANFV